MDCFFALLPPMDSQNQNFQKKNGKNTSRYYHFIKINDSHIMYGSSDMEWNRHNFLSIRNLFCSFNPITTQKLKILKK